MLDADIVIKEINAPPNNWCDSGHVAPKVYKRSGPNSNPEPTKFFTFKSKNKCGVYCEPCLVIARYIAKKRKQNETY